ncbi:DUF4240 domain-containing protein [Nonomuraea angiospora]|uniref:DUF4240 domain-containing protein n=1 Tax=Nonomuraea angiospora TaxID=46172 RepID=UPI0033182019
MYAAFYITTGYASSGGFEYFADWLISLGREDFEKAVDRPDRILELSHNCRHERTSMSRDGQACVRTGGRPGLERLGGCRRGARGREQIPLPELHRPA